MRWAASTMLGVVLATAVVASSRWAAVPLAHRGTMRADCSTCHARSAPRTHTREFLDRGHGPVALQNRQECLVCHEDTEASCDQCHSERPPDWHTDDFRNPRLGTQETREHLRIAHTRRESCVECHATTYTTRCVECHRPEEGWLGRSQEKIR